MREIGVTRPFRFIGVLPVIICYGLTIAFVAVLSSGMDGNVIELSVFSSLAGSLAFALLVCLFCAPPALALAVCFFGMRDAKPFHALYGMLDAIAAAPPIVTAYVVMIAARRMGIPLSHLIAAAALLLAFMPRLCTQLTDVLRAVPRRYYLSSVALGDKPRQALNKVVFREARGGIISCVLLMGIAIINELALLQITLGYSVGEELASAMDNPPLALLIQQSVRLGDTHTGAMAALVLLALDIALSFLTRRMMRPRA